jgi:hypothetical protein
LSGIRNTEAHFTNGDPAVFEMDDWREQDRARAELPGEWVGRSVFSKAEQPELQSSSPEKPKADPKRGEFLKRRRAKTGQLQRGSWLRSEDGDLSSLMEISMAHFKEQQCRGRSVLNDTQELFSLWKEKEMARPEFV